MLTTNGNGTSEVNNDIKSENSAENGKLSNGQNGEHSTTNPGEVSCLDPEIFDLNSTNLHVEDNEKKDELISRFLRHQKILMSNCEQAET